MFNMMTALHSEKGFSILETLVSTGMGFLILMIAAYLIIKQSEELNHLRDRIDVNNVQLEVQRTLMDPAACLAGFKPPFVIDETKVEAPSYSISMTHVLNVRVGSPLRADSPHITVARIDAAGFTRLSANSYRFDLKIFVNSTDGTSILPITIPRLRVATHANSPANGKTVQSCHPDSSPVTGPGNCRRIESADFGPALCQAGERVLSGGGTCLFDVEPAYLRATRPVTVNGRPGWEVDCATEKARPVKAKAYAYCCT